MYVFSCGVGCLYCGGFRAVGKYVVCRLLVYVYIVCGVWGLFFCFVFCVGVVGRWFIMSYVSFVWFI